MLDRTKLKRLGSHGGCLYPDVCVDDAMIEYWEKQIGSVFPNSYKEWLKEFGAMGPVNICGIEGYDFSDVVRDTEQLREKKQLPKAYLVVKSCRELEPKKREWVYCLDTGRMQNGECPVVEYDLETMESKDHSADFETFFQWLIETQYEEKVRKGRICLEEEETELPTGMDYRSCFMTVKGCDSEQIVSDLALTNLRRMNYFEALDLVCKNSGKAMVTDADEGRNFVFFHWYDAKKILRRAFVVEKCAHLPVVDLYAVAFEGLMQGFLHAENGTLQRYYSADRDRILSFGKKLPEEKELKLYMGSKKLATSLEEALDYKKYFRVHEDAILRMAGHTSEVSIRDYVYGEVWVGDVDLEMPPMEDYPSTQSELEALESKEQGKKKASTKGDKKRKGKEAETEKVLPDGIGYKSAWMVVEGQSQTALRKSLLKKGAKKHTYSEGLDIVAEEATADKPLVAITKSQEKRSFVIGDAVAGFFWNREAFLDKIKDFSRVYIYMTHRVSETHGYAIVEEGRIKRLVYTGDDGSENIGEALPEENGMESVLTEDSIVALAAEQTGVDPETFEYEDVIVGELCLEIGEERNI